MAKPQKETKKPALEQPEDNSTPPDGDNTQPATVEVTKKGARRARQTPLALANLIARGIPMAEAKKRLKKAEGENPDDLL